MEIRANGRERRCPQGKERRDQSEQALWCTGTSPHWALWPLILPRKYSKFAVRVSQLRECCIHISDVYSRCVIFFRRHRRARDDVQVPQTWYRQASESYDEYMRRTRSTQRDSTAPCRTPSYAYHTLRFHGPTYHGPTRAAHRMLPSATMRCLFSSFAHEVEGPIGIPCAQHDTRGECDSESSFEARPARHG